MKPARHLMMKIGLGAVALAALGFGAHALTTTPEGPQVATAIASMGNVENAVLASGSLHPSNVLPVGVSLDPENTTANPNAIYYNVTFETPNPDDVLLPSMTAEVHVVLNHAVNVLTVPVASITDGASGKRTVEIVDARGEISTREVTVGVENSFTAEIRSGLKVGDRVVV